MTLTFADASRALVTALEKTKEFTEACAEQVENIKDELAGTESALRSVLAHQEHLKLPDGSYLYMKESQSSRALNETRIAHAIEMLTPAQCAQLARDHKEWNQAQVLVEAIADNLYEECVVSTSAPAIAKKMPKDVSWRPAPATVVSHAERFQELQKKLAAMRKHRSAGKKRAAAVQAVAEPVVHAYLDKQQVAQKVVQFGQTAAAASASESEEETYFPPLPTMPSLPNMPEVSRPSVSEKPMEHIDTNDALLNGKKVMFASRTYTSRGKAPKLNTFLDALPQTLQSLTWTEVTADLKRNILDKLLSLFQSQFQKSQGTVKKRLVLKPIY